MQIFSHSCILHWGKKSFSRRRAKGHSCIAIALTILPLQRSRHFEYYHQSKVAKKGISKNNKIAAKQSKECRKLWCFLQQWKIWKFVQKMWKPWKKSILLERLWWGRKPIFQSPAIRNCAKINHLKWFWGIYPSLYRVSYLHWPLGTFLWWHGEVIYQFLQDILMEFDMTNKKVPL